MPSFHTTGALSRKLVLSCLVILFIFALCSIPLLGYSVYKSEITGFIQKHTSQLPPTITPASSWSTLQIGGTTLRYTTTYMSSDGSTNIPVIFPAPLYRMGSSEKNYLFILTRTRANLRLFSSLKGGEQAIITLDNCTTATFVLSAPQSGEPTSEMLLHQPTGIIIYIPHQGSSDGFTVVGQLVGESMLPYPA